MFHGTYLPPSKIDTVLDLTWDIMHRRRAPAKERNFHALSLRLEGDCTIECEGMKLDLKQYDIFFVPKSTGYRMTTRKNEHVICVHFDMPDAGTLPTSFTPTDPAIFVSLFEEISDVWAKKETGYLPRAYALFHEIVYHIIRQQSEVRHRDYNAAKALTLQIAAALRERFTDPELSVAAIAREFFISETYFRRLFHKHLNCSPGAYITEQRLKYATELLRSGYYTVEEAAAKCGIENVKYFSTLYKKKKGVSPSKIKV